MQVVIEQIVKEFLAGIAELDGARERLFLNWLSSHSHQVDCTSQDVSLPEALSRWLSALEPANLLWEYRLVLGEIEWCAMLDLDELERFLQEQA